MPKHLLRCAVVLGAGLVGCVPDSLDENDDYDVVISVRERGHDFDDYKTFAMQEQVIDLSAISDDPIEINHDLDDEILEEVAEQMAALGYDRTTDAQGADVNVVVGAVASNNWSWYGYYPWYGYGWDSYYWYYPPVAVPVNTPTGSLVMLMIDTQQAEENDEGMTLVPVVWASSVRGLLGSDSANVTKARKLIDQAFDQSSYLKTDKPVDAEPGIGADGGVVIPDGGIIDLGDEDGGAP